MTCLTNWRVINRHSFELWKQYDASRPVIRRQWDGRSIGAGGWARCARWAEQSMDAETSQNLNLFDVDMMRMLT